MDRTAPSITRLRVSGPLYPERDGYADAVSLAGTVSETGRYAFRIRSARGALVRTVPVTFRGMEIGARWDGRTAGGQLVPYGTYRLSVYAVDTHGNAAERGPVSLAVRAGKLELRKASRTISATTGLRDYSNRYCSYALPGYHGAGNLALGSQVRCSEGDGDVVVALYGFDLPAAVRYGTVQLTASGEYAFGAGTLALSLGVRGFQPGYTNLTEDVRRTALSTPRVRASSAVLTGRQLSWSIGVSDGTGWVASSYRIDWTYYVLR